MASPPSLPSISIPRKRPSVASISTKKRKPSNLRNSFAPEEAEYAGSPLRYSRSPSVDSAVTGSVSGLTAATVGKRGRKRKADDASSIAGGASVRGGASKAGSKAGSTVNADGAEADNDDASDWEDDGEGVDAVLDAEKLDGEDEQEEAEHRRILMDALTPDQFARYEAYRRVRMKKEIVRKLVNHILSQSVPQTVLLTIMGLTKIFVGELLDRAVDVRDQYAAARTHIPNPALPVNVLHIGLQKATNHDPSAKPSSKEIIEAGMHPAHVHPGLGYWVPKPEYEEGEWGEKLKIADKGPITPDHLREALRRYKKARPGGGAGFRGLSLEGPERTMARTGGKRLFR